MRRLRDFQLVMLLVGELEVPCRVVATGGDEAVLEAESFEQLRWVVLPAAARLVFQSSSHPVMLAGAVDAGPIPETVAFRVTDRVEVRQLRMAPRLSVATDMRVVPLGEDGRELAPAAWYATIDLSSVGVAVRGHAAPPRAPVGFELVVPTLPRSVRGTAHVVRLTPGGTAMAFEAIDATTATMIDRMIFTVRQRVARRAFWQYGSLRTAA